MSVLPLGVTSFLPGITKSVPKGYFIRRIMIDTFLSPKKKLEVLKSYFSEAAQVHRSLCHATGMGCTLYFSVYNSFFSLLAFSNFDKNLLSQRTIPTPGLCLRHYLLVGYTKGSWDSAHLSKGWAIFLFSLWWWKKVTHSLRGQPDKQKKISPSEKSRSAHLSPYARLSTQWKVVKAWRLVIRLAAQKQE